VSDQALYGLWLLAALLCGCAANPPLPATPAVPGAWEHPAAGSGAQWPGAEWYHGFGSDELDSLVAAAAANNLDLAAAEARIRQADARARAAGAAILPQVDVGANAMQVSGRSRDVSARETDSAALLSASYEVDFWGRNRAIARSAQAAAEANRADRNTVALTALAGVADTYFEVLSLRERLALAHSNLDTTRDVLKAIEARADAGVASPLELAQQRAAVASAELQIPQLAQQEMQARGALALLLGRAPEGFDVTGQKLDALREPALGPGLPSELLTRRPDLIAAEARLEAAHADLAAARAALFPTITLTGSGGLQNPGFQAVLTTLPGAGHSVSIGASVVQTIFDRGRRRALGTEAQAREQELVANYRAAILASLLDVETALSALGQLDLQQRAQNENVTQSERALEGAQLRYHEGSADYLALLESQRALYAAREQMSRYRLARLEAWVGLCKALGGGWQAAAPDKEPRRP